MFGVDILAGKLKSASMLMNEQGDVIGRVKEIQDSGKSMDEAKKGDSVAISIDGITLGRQLKEGDVLYTHLNDDEERLLRGKFNYLLSDEEKDLLDLVAKIKRTKK
ncbi:putative translation initiation factor IF-2 [uncultured archaeon]|nr:putative translation initiation factor IF-2 [uncultured archaeon]